MKTKEEMICDIVEALEKMEFWRPLYVKLREKHGREEAMKILRWMRENNPDIDEPTREDA